MLTLCVVADVDDVKFVINFDYPTNSEDYVHRIGRTGRQFKTGTAYTFFTPANANKAKDLINVLQEANQVVNPKLQELAQSGGFQKRKLVNFSIFLFKFYDQIYRRTWRWEKYRERWRRWRKI